MFGSDWDGQDQERGHQRDEDALDVSEMKPKRLRDCRFMSKMMLRLEVAGRGPEERAKEEIYGCSERGNHISR